MVSWETTRGNNVNGKHDEWEFSRLNIFWVGTVLDRIFWIGIIRVGIFWVVIIVGGDFSCGSYPGWEFCGQELFGGNQMGGNFPGGSFPSAISSQVQVNSENQTFFRKKTLPRQKPT